MIERLWSRVVLATLAFAIIGVTIGIQPPNDLDDFDQSFYLTIAYDLDRHGVFSNGVFDNVDSTQTIPPSGMFFVPGYPLLVLAAMKVDHRFAAAVKCSVEASSVETSSTEASSPEARDTGDASEDDSDCEPYARPIHIIHAFLLALSVLAIAASTELMFKSRASFWLAGALATASFSAEAFIISYVMTESMTVALYSLFAFSLVLAWSARRTRDFVIAGVLLGALCLTRPSFLILLPITVGLSLLHLYRPCGLARTATWTLSLTVAFAIVVGAWVARNAWSVGKVGLTEEYGAAVLIERFAYNNMTAREFILSFPYCTPGIGDVTFDLADGNDSMHRFVYHTEGSFFNVGRAHRDALVKTHGRLDPLIGGIIRDEMSTNWWRHLLSSIPLAWCGMWAGRMWGLLLVPLFVYASIRAIREDRPLLLLYAAPAVAMLGLHAAVANHYTRYNLILIGPLAAGAAWIISTWLSNMRLRSQEAAKAVKAVKAA